MQVYYLGVGLNMNAITQKILPLSDERPITYDLRLAIPHMAALSHDEIKDNVWQWLYSFSTQTICRRKQKHIRYNYFQFYVPFFPFIKRHRDLHGRKNWSDPEKKLQYVIDKIDDGYYVHLEMDRFYMPGFQGFNETHFIHTECIYGYDLDKKVLYVTGFTELMGANLQKRKLEFDDFRKAYFSFAQKKLCHWITNQRVRRNVRVDFDVGLMKKQLSCYINSTRPSLYVISINGKKRIKLPFEPRTSAFGINANKFVADLILKEYEGSLHSNHSLRLHALYEFQNLMAKRLAYLALINFVDKNYADDYATIATKYLSLRNLYLKYDITKKREVLISIYRKLKSLQDEEEIILHKVIVCLNENG